jgi:hypothetical protein
MVRPPTPPPDPHDPEWGTWIRRHHIKAPLISSPLAANTEVPEWLHVGNGQATAQASQDPAQPASLVRRGQSLSASLLSLRDKQKRIARAASYNASLDKLSRQRQRTDEWGFPVLVDEHAPLVLPPPVPDPIHREIRSMMLLANAHAHKVYVSGPLTRVDTEYDGLERERQPCFWAQLKGTTLSLWNMDDIQAANRRGGQASPRYLNVTDAVRR